jgi:uncharacterized protein (DUF2384 family)
MAKSITAGRLRVPRPQRAAVPASDEMRRRVRWLIGALGNNRVAELLGVSRSQPSRWKSGDERVAPRNRRAVLDLEYVMARLYELWTPEVAAIWLESSNAHLGGARPVDVLRLRGAAEVVGAIDAEDEGAYA